MNTRKLIAAEIKSIRKLATSMCANYDNHYKECVLLNGDCYMIYGIGYANNALCKYFKEAVLPLNPSLEAIFSGNCETKQCKICGTEFVPVGRQEYCSEKCRAKSNRIANVARVRKYRKKKYEM